MLNPLILNICRLLQRKKTSIPTVGQWYTTPAGHVLRVNQPYMYQEHLNRNTPEYRHPQQDIRLMWKDIPSSQHQNYKR